MDTHEKTHSARGGAVFLPAFPSPTSPPSPSQFPTPLRPCGRLRRPIFYRFVASLCYYLIAFFGDLLIAQCATIVQPLQQCLVLFSRHARVQDPQFWTLLIFGSFIALHAVNPARLLLHPADSLTIPPSPHILSLITLVWPLHSSHAGLMHLCSTRCVLRSSVASSSACAASFTTLPAS